jgi:hypothetical protein
MLFNQLDLKLLCLIISLCNPHRQLFYFSRAYMMLQELLSQDKAQASSSINQEVDLDELMDVSLIVLLASSILMQMFLFIKVFLHWVTLGS